MQQISRLILVGLLAWIVSFGAVFAQTSRAIDYETFTPLAAKAEQTLVTGRASDNVLEDLRTELADWRDQFQQGQSINQDRIETLKSQLDALGPIPEDGDDPVADRRLELNEQLTELRAPVKRAVEAYSRADGLIREIDNLLRSRQTSVLLSVGPNPLNPANWELALIDLSKTFETPIGGVNSFIAPLSLNQSVSSYLSSIFFTLLGIVIVFAGTQVLKTQTREWNTLSPRFGAIAEFLQEISGLIILPLIGVGFLSIGLQLSGLFGARGILLLENAPTYASWIFIAYWSYYRLFARPNALLQDSSQIKLWVALLALIVMSRDMLFDLAEFDFYSANSKAVINLPFIFIGSFVLFRFSNLLRLRPKGEGEASAENNLIRRVLRVLVVAGKTIAVLAPILAVIGYGHIATGTLFPFLKTVLYLAGLVALHAVVTRLVNVLFGYDKDADTLLSIVVAVLLLSVWVPLIALLWGVRETDLLELWTTFINGFKLGETTLTPSDFIAFVVIFIVGYSLTRFIQSTLKTAVLPKTNIDTGGQNAIVSGFGYIGIFLAALIAISSTGLDLSSLAIVAGALSVGIGFGLQNIVSNFVSGIILLIERPVSEGDWIEVGGQMGYVRNISVRSTRIETFDRSDVIVPNADLVSGVVTNWTRGNTIGRLIVPIGVAYGNDTRRVEAILRDIIEAHPMVLLNPPPSVIFQGFGADSMDFEIRAILRDVNWMLSVKSDVNHSIAERFVAEGIEIPYAQRDIWIRNPEALAGGRNDDS